MADGYVYPTPQMISDYAAASRRAPGAGVPVNTSSLGAPQVAGPQQPLSFRQRLGLFIMGADAGSVFFPPQQPLQPIAQPANMGAVGRQWDFPVGYNTRVQPRTGERIGFPFLKALSEYDVVALMIGRVKDELTAREWIIGPRDRKAKADARCDLLMDFFAYPDKLHTFKDWLRELLDQVLIYDAPAVWLCPDRKGDLHSLQIIQGQSITPKIMADGRLPPPNFGPAYQQVLKGIGAVDYIQPVPKGQPVPKDADGQPMPELLYKPRNPRVDLPYGYSPVEQIVRTIEIGALREDFLKDFYTAGSMPDVLVGVPDGWQPEQIEQFQSVFDAVLAGNLAKRRGVRFIPGAMKPYETKPNALTDATDEWLIRVMCFAFGLSPMPFTKMMNRASGEQHAKQQADEGELPWLSWVADWFTHLIYLKFGWRDLVFRWEEQEDTDPLIEAQRFALYLTNKVYHPDEVRAKLGDDAMSQDMRDQMDVATYANTPNATILPDDQQQAKDDAAQALAAAKPAPVIAPPGSGGKPAPGVAGKAVGKPQPHAAGRSARAPY